MRLTREDIALFWGEEQAAFNHLRQLLQTPSVLAHFDEDAPTTIHTNAGNIGLSTVLVQWQDSAAKVIAYTSRTVSRV